jgi:transcriptional regulator with XRE-family HTH domain
MRSADIIRIARQRAGLTQQQLADRAGHPRATIARWETGVREPSLATLEGVVAACDLDLVIHLAKRDPSLQELVADQLELAAGERLRRLMTAAAARDAQRALRWLAAARTPTIAIGGVAAALQGAPQRPAGAQVEVVSGDPFALEGELEQGGLVPTDTDDRWAATDRRATWALPKGGAIVLATDVAGSGDYADLRRSADSVALDGATSVAVAHPRDLLRLADASPRESERARVPGLRALLSELGDRGAT